MKSLNKEKLVDLGNWRIFKRKEYKMADVKNTLII